MAIIYALVSSLSPDEIRYVGKSQYDTPKNRVRKHLREAERNISNTHKCNWIRKVLKSGGEVLAITIENNLTSEQAIQREVFLISHYRSLGYNLTNMTNGGEGVVGCPVSAKTKAKISKSTIDYYAKFPEAREKLRAANKGKTLSPETRAKIGASSVGNTHALGYRHTEEAKAKIVAANKGRPLSREHVAKIVAANKGRIVTEETRAKTSASLKARHGGLTK